MPQNSPAHEVARRTSKISSGVTELYTYDDADKLLTRGSTSYTYDACGRTKTIVGSGGTRTFTWDYEDRLTNLSGGGVSSMNYGYNGVGTRTSKSNAGGSRSYKRNGVGVTAPVLSDGVATMVPGISEKSGGVTSTIHSDRLGSMKGLSASGTMTDTANYDAFGKVVARTGTNSTQKGFASGFGYQEDGESGYKLLGHRYYDAETGRFLSRDRAMDGRNWYAYCDNSPLKSIDPEGLKKKLYIIIGDLTSNYDIRTQTALMQSLVDQYGDDYDIEFKHADTRDDFIRLMSECDAAILTGHGNMFSTRKNGIVRDSDFIAVARNRRRHGKGPLDFIIVYCCAGVDETDVDTTWLLLTNDLTGYTGDCFAAGGPKRAKEGQKHWGKKYEPGYDPEEGRVWTTKLPTIRKPSARGY